MPSIETPKNSDYLNPFMLGDWYVEPKSDRISCGETQVRLEPRVMEVLVFLAARHGQVVSREELEASVWAGMVVGYEALTSTMRKLRKALGDDTKQPRYIETVSKRGYRLIAEVRIVAEAPQDTKNVTKSARSSPVTPGQGRDSKHAVIILLVILLAGVAGWILYSEFAGVTHTKPGSPVPIAVQPSNNMSGDPEQEYFSDGISEDIITDLSRLKNLAVIHRTDTSLPSLVVLPFSNMGGKLQQEYLTEGVTADITTDLSQLGSLRVIARQTASTYRGDSVSAQQVGDELGILEVVEGSIQRVGDQLRINVQLTDAENNYLMWGERFDREMGDIFAVQDDITSHIVNALSIEISDEERRRLAHRYTNSVQAYEVFLRGQQAYVQQNADDNVRAQEYYRRAIGLDPLFARAYAALALTYSDDWRYGWSNNSEKGEAEALRLARRAIAMDNNLPQAYWVLGFVQIFRGEYMEAINASERAIALDPNNSDAYATLAISTNFSGNPEKAIALMQQAIALNPRYGSRYSAVLAMAYYHAGKYEEALAALDDSLNRNPELIPPHLYKTVILMKMDRKEDAEWQVDEVLAIKPDFTLDNLDRILPFRDDTKRGEFASLLREAGFHKKVKQ